MPKSKRFKKPTLQEVEVLCEAKDYTFDPETFWNYYESNGWRVGRNKMKSWKAAAAYWHSRRKNKPGSRVTIKGDPSFKGRF
jgi:hypothetical protein